VSFFLGKRSLPVLRTASCRAVHSLNTGILQSCSARHVPSPVAASFQLARELTRLLRAEISSPATACSSPAVHRRWTHASSQDE
jgi:hypothetical protein